MKSGEVVQELYYELIKRKETDYIVAEGKGEGYQLNWPGKKQAELEVSSPTVSRLRPIKHESINWQETRNIYIEGDNKEVLKLLQGSYRNSIKMIYIDPPYNTGKQYVYNDRYDSDDWLSMMYVRLKLAYSLLSEDGVIFVSIDDREQANLFKLLEEQFGRDNFVAHIVWQKKYAPANDASLISATHEHILLFAKNSRAWSPGLLPRTAKQQAAYSNPDDDHRGVWRPSDLSVRSYHKYGDYPIVGPTGEVFYPPPGRVWGVNRERYKELLADGRITFGKHGKSRPMQKKFLTEVKQGITPDTWWSRDKVGDNKAARYELKELLPANVFDTPKPSSLITYMMKVANVGHNDIVLDFFSGSATTAHAVMALNATDQGRRSYILVQLPEPTKPLSRAAQAGYANICEIGKERIRRAASKIKEESGANIDYGYRLFRLESSGRRSAHTADDYLVEAMLQLGLPLTLSFECHEVADTTIYQAGGLIAYFTDSLCNAVIMRIVKKQPHTLVLRATALADQKKKAALETILSMLSPLTKLKLLD